MTGQGMRSRLLVVASLLQLVALVGTGSSCSVYALQEVGAGDYLSWSMLKRCGGMEGLVVSLILGSSPL